ncbi:hypothetical protein GPECTOR_36g83 [Gonium pectorale]|uniref:Uncharacterized protein n=1 Tax=Gonium pectorale TaxID=33097 RepID=A0A150GBY1_GONPE|nr:hypothetical protein GPECTOR_36g83 [Gonium pectorale]|eukprot:KXZ47361.1 hypothetical protein GPECTOR_36g83 [Gonium pectorale]
MGEGPLTLLKVAAAASSVPLAAIAYKGTGLAAFARAASVAAAAPLAVSVLAPSSRFTARATEPGPRIGGNDITGPEELRALLRAFRPLKLLKLLCEWGVGALGRCARRTESDEAYLQRLQEEVEQEEQQEAEKRRSSLEAAMDMAPAGVNFFLQTLERLLTGDPRETFLHPALLCSLARSVAVDAARGVLGALVARCIGAERAEPFRVEFGRAPGRIRELLMMMMMLQGGGSSSSLVTCALAAAQAAALAQAADFAVAVVQHTYCALRRGKRKGLAGWARGLGQQALRCSLLFGWRTLQLAIAAHLTTDLQRLPLGIVFELSTSLVTLRIQPP